MYDYGTHRLSFGFSGPKVGALSSVIIPLAFLSLLVLFVVIELRKGTKDIWRRLLVE